ncbi:hypothetical protein [Rhodopseudomonas sp. B29]|uniref:hypothetical protein n=1 Tax=Rhodopseudomonas sp. B29 TaxID=95607 RepID=UPI00034AEA4A|nr:hypothetical protein [Rhodopseudomonas sp. B29]
MIAQAAELHVTLDVDDVTGRCDCCGHVSREVWGTIETDEEAVAVYSVHWTIGHIPDLGAEIDLLIGRWGDGTSAADRVAVRMHHFIGPTGPAVMVQDASLARGREALAATALKRDDIIGTPRADEVFALYDALALQDCRLAELFGVPPPCAN